MSPENKPNQRRRRRAWRAMTRNITTLAGLVLTSVILLVALFAPWLVPFDPIQQNLMQGDLAPGPLHVLGTDSYGRDVLSRVIMGGRVSLTIALSLRLVWRL